MLLKLREKFKKYDVNILLSFTTDHSGTIDTDTLRRNSKSFNPFTLHKQTSHQAIRLNQQN